MIRFELKCTQQHRFEGWFRNGSTFEDQAARGEIECPYCGDTAVAKALMAPNVISGRRTDDDQSEKAAESAETVAPDDKPKALREAIDRLRRQVEESCDDVGQDFADEARRIHRGEAEERGIYGEATKDDARDLKEEGIPVFSLPWKRKVS